MLPEEPSEEPTDISDALDDLLKTVE